MYCFAQSRQINAIVMTIKLTYWLGRALPLQVIYTYTYLYFEYWIFHSKPTLKEINRSANSARGVPPTPTSRVGGSVLAGLRTEEYERPLRLLRDLKEYLAVGLAFIFLLFIRE